jgi:hypothetical protein
MYVYLIPKGGLNDILATVNYTLNYCKTNKRKLLLDTNRSEYRVTFDDYFHFDDEDIITDSTILQTILANEELSIYPEAIKVRDITKIETKFNDRKYNYKGIDLCLPNDCPNNIIIYVACGGGDGLKIFSMLNFKKNIIDHIKNEYNKMPHPYLCIQVRNTDKKCDYEVIYEQNRQLIDAYKNIYLATDDEEVLKFYREKGLAVYNFTTFPSVPFRNLHNSNLTGDIKIKNLLCDMFIISMSDKLLSNSVGGFIKLVRKLHEKKDIMKNKLGLETN